VNERKYPKYFFATYSEEHYGVIQWLFDSMYTTPSSKMQLMNIGVVGVRNEKNEAFIIAKDNTG
jgi:hypothetical protein